MSINIHDFILTDIKCITNFSGSNVFSHRSFSPLMFLHCFYASQGMHGSKIKHKIEEVQIFLETFLHIPLCVHPQSTICTKHTAYIKFKTIESSFWLKKQISGARSRRR